LVDVSTKIRTFSESVDPTSGEISALRAALQASPRIVYLGFAFHEMNMNLLYPPNESANVSGSRRIYATALEVSESDVGVIRRDLVKRSGTQAEKISLWDGMCAPFFSHFSRTLREPV
jgi:hypothetical protein